MAIKFRVLSALSISAFFLCMVSCTTYKNFNYMEDFADTAKPELIKTVPFKSPVIQTDDILSITIQTIDNDVTNMLNNNTSINNSTTTMPVLSSSNASPISPAQNISGYLVDKDGFVEIPFVG